MAGRGPAAPRAGEAVARRFNPARVRVAASRPGARAPRREAREREAHHRRAASATCCRLADVGAARRLHDVHDRGGPDREIDQPASDDRVRRRVRSRVYSHANVHADVHGAAVGLDTVRDAHTGGRGACAVIYGAGCGVTLLRLVAQQVRARVDHGLPPFPTRAVPVPRAGSAARLGSLRRVGSRCLLHDGAVRARARLLRAARRQSVEIPRTVSGAAGARVAHIKEADQRVAASSTAAFSNSINTSISKQTPKQTQASGCQPVVGDLGCMRGVPPLVPTTFSCGVCPNTI